MNQRVRPSLPGLLTHFCGLFLALSLSVPIALAAPSNPTADLSRLSGSFSSALRQDALSSYRDFEQGPFSASIHGIFREISRFHSIQASYNDVSIPTEALQSGDLTVQLHVARADDGSVLRAPLAIVLNPLFGEKYFFQMTRFIQFFGERGYHVVVFENTFADPVTTHAPRFYPGDVQAESAMHRQVIDSVIARLGAANVSGATMVGLSYGAFLASVIKADDAASPSPRIDGPTLLIDPPYDILNSMKNLDRFVEESNADGGKLCMLSLDFPRLLINGFFVDDTQKVKINEKCAKAFLSVFGFTGRLHHSLGELKSSKKLALSSSQISSMNFESYLDQMARVRIAPGMSEVNYWIRSAKRLGYDSFLVVGATDDPINERFDPAHSLSGPIDPIHLLEVPTGGHTGLRSANSRDPLCKDGWLGCLLEKVYAYTYEEAPAFSAPLLLPDANPAGACTDAQDAAVPKATMETQETSCARKCLGGNSCTAQCVAGALGLTAECGSCWGQVAECGKQHCAFQCGLSPTSGSCRSCTASHGCDAAFTTCAGI